MAHDKFYTSTSKTNFSGSQNNSRAYWKTVKGVTSTSPPPPQRLSNRLFVDGNTTAMVIECRQSCKIPNRVLLLIAAPRAPSSVAPLPVHTTETNLTKFRAHFFKLLVHLQGMKYTGFKFVLHPARGEFPVCVNSRCREHDPNIRLESRMRSERRVLV